VETPSSAVAAPEGSERHLIDLGAAAGRKPLPGRKSGELLARRLLEVCPSFSRKDWQILAGFEER
jgi:hypothetical protein